MEDFESIHEMYEDMGYIFEVQKERDFHGSVTKTTAYCIYNYEGIIVNDYTQKNVFWILLGIQILNCNRNTYISEYNLIMSAIEETIMNYKQFTISEEEKQEIYGYALKLKEELPKLKIEYDPHAK